MASSSTTLPISSTVSELWRAERDGGAVRALLVVVRNEVCTLLAQRTAEGDTAADFAALADAVPRDSACYVLFRTDGARWALLSWVPDAAPVREKTLYASALAALRHDLGERYLVLGARLSRADEFDWAALQAAQQPVECLSAREQHLRELDAMEATARREMEDAARERRSAAGAATTPKGPASGAARPMPVPPKSNKTTTATTPNKTATTTAPNKTATTTPSTNGSSVAAMRHAFENPSELPAVQRPAKGTSSATSEFGNADALGGYHTVSLPLTGECEDALARLASGAAATVVMRIERETVALVRAGSEGAGALGALLDAAEPRFLLHRAAGGRTLFVYCCPDRSRPQLRMVYATAKPSVVDAAARHGLTVAGRLEVRSGAELTAAAVAEALRPRRAGAAYAAGCSSPGSARAAPAAAACAVRAPHPVYSQIAPNRAGAGPMKRIVLPPSAAY